MESTKSTVSHRREDGGGEEEDMEMFFALVKNFRSKLHQLQENRGGKRKRSAPAGGWAPAFRLEDFTTDIQFKKHVPPALAESSCNNSDKNYKNGFVDEQPNSPNLKLRL